MSRRQASWVTALLLGVCMVLPAPSALACSAPPCPTVEVFPAPGELPAWFQTFRVPGSSGGLSASLRRTDLADAADVEIKIEERDGETWLSPAQALVSGAHYALEVTRPCAFDGVVTATFSYDVIGTAPQPPALGEVQIVGEGTGQVPVANDASCYESIEVSYVDVRPSLAAEHEELRTRFADYRVLVDGKAFTWAMSENGGFFADVGGPPNEAWFTEPDVFRLWMRCADSEHRDFRGLAPGKHAVVIEARLPVVDGIWIRTKTAEITLACAEVDAGSAASDTPPAPSSVDATDSDSEDVGSNRSNGCQLAETSRASRPTACLVVVSLMLLARSRRRLTGA